MNDSAVAPGVIPANERKKLAEHLRTMIEIQEEIGRFDEVSIGAEDAYRKLGTLTPVDNLNDDQEEIRVLLGRFMSKLTEHRDRARSRLTREKLEIGMLLLKGSV